MQVHVTFNGQIYDENLPYLAKASSAITIFADRHEVSFAERGMALSTAYGRLLDDNEAVLPGEDLVLRPRRV